MILKANQLNENFLFNYKIILINPLFKVLFQYFMHMKTFKIYIYWVNTHLSIGASVPWCNIINKGHTSPETKVGTT